MTWPLRRAMNRCGSRLISSDRANSSSSVDRENCWLSITCVRREPTAIKNSFPASQGPDLKDLRARAALGGLYLRADEQATGARRGHDRGCRLLVLRQTTHLADRAASARRTRAHHRDVRDLSPHAVKLNRRGGPRA